MALREGKVSIHYKGFGFIKTSDNKTYFLPKRNRKSCLHGDIVLFSITKETSLGENHQAIACVREVINSKHQYLVVLVTYVDQKKVLIVDDVKIQEKIIVKSFKTLLVNFKYLLQIEKVDCGVIYCQIIKNIGHKNQIGIDTLSIVASLGIDQSFPNLVIKKANQISEVISTQEKAQRVDLTNKQIITIDDITAKDLDDAIRVEKLANGNYLLGVYVADVAHYVQPKSILDQEAYKRASSIYLLNQVIPMLPEKLSNLICSLNPQVERLVMACEMEFSSKGDLIKSHLFEALIKTTARMSYDEVNDIYNNNHIDIFDDTHEFLKQKYHHLNKLLGDAQELALILMKKKTNSGMIEFNFNESNIILNQQDKVINIDLKQRGFAQKMIEIFMINANEVVSQTIAKLHLPSIYRVHKAPQDEQLNEFYQFTKTLGKHFETKNNVKPHDIQKIINLHKDSSVFSSLGMQLLKAMDKAVYSSQNNGHFGLASPSYSHFTSPIRRYADLILHRLVKDYLITKKINLAYWQNNLQEICLHISNMEKKAIDCERKVIAMKKAEWASNNLHKEYEGLIMGVIDFGFFVQISNGVEGLVSISDLYDDQYEHIPHHYLLKGQNQKRVFKVGNKVQVFIKRASKQIQKVDFGLVEFKNLTIINDNLKKQQRNQNYKAKS